MHLLTMLEDMIKFCLEKKAQFDYYYGYYGLS